MNDQEKLKSNKRILSIREQQVIRGGKDDEPPKRTKLKKPKRYY